MEAKMAHVVHQHHVETFKIWTTGIFFALLAFVLIYFSMTNSTDLVSVSASLPEPPTAPLFW
jgi:hypothetical protein